MSVAELRARGLDIPAAAVSVWPFERWGYRGGSEYLRRLEDDGVRMLWLGEVPGREAFVGAFASLAATRTLIVGTGVARALERTARVAATSAEFLWDAFPHRYLSGLGVSGASRDRGVGPGEFLRDYLDEVDHTHEGRGLRVPRVIGAYSPMLTALARDRADGLLTFMVTPEHTAWARSTLGPEPFLSVSCRVLLDCGAPDVYDVARQRLLYYLKLPHQRNKLLRWGFEAADFEDGGSERLIDAMFAWGSPDEIVEKLRRHYVAGADQVVLALDRGPDAELTGRAAQTVELLDAEHASLSGR